MAFKPPRRRARTFDAPIMAFLRRKPEHTGGRASARDRPISMRTQDASTEAALANPKTPVRPPSEKKSGPSVVGLILKKQQDRAEEINNPVPEETTAQTIRRKSEENASRLQYMIRRAKEYWNKP